MLRSQSPTFFSKLLSILNGSDGGFVPNARTTPLLLGSSCFSWVSRREEPCAFRGWLKREDSLASADVVQKFGRRGRASRRSQSTSLDKVMRR